jgi:hypothetical protein
MARFQPIDDSYDASSTTRLGTAFERIAGQVEEAWPRRKGDGGGCRSRIAENAGEGLVLGIWRDWLGRRHLGSFWRVPEGVANVDVGSSS